MQLASFGVVQHHTLFTGLSLIVRQPCQDQRQTKMLTLQKGAEFKWPHSCAVGRPSRGSLEPSTPYSVHACCGTAMPHQTWGLFRVGAEQRPVRHQSQLTASRWPSRGRLLTEELAEHLLTLARASLSRVCNPSRLVPLTRRKGTTLAAGRLFQTPLCCMGVRPEEVRSTK